jgi:3-phosphoshikimate 1-carboxyvinyltransferase
MKRLQGTVHLPGSKSESNRVLMIAAYGGFPLEAENLSEAHDTVLMKALLEKVRGHISQDSLVVDCEDAGTVSRFLMTYLACAPGEWLLTGTGRLCERPMAPLIDALRQLGADITCVEKEGCLPVRIRGNALKGGSVNIDASQSSQFVSSLLMAAPTWNNGLQLTLTGESVSEPYIDMTLSMMERFGVHASRKGKAITVARQLYRPCHFTVSVDWSAASYWYEMLALSAGGSMLLKGLRHDSLQGDARVADLFQPFGIETEFTEEGVLITSTGVLSSVDQPLEFDFYDTPDLFPSVLVTCVALHIKAVFYGITTLFIKESDRVNSLITELSKIYTFINIIENDRLIIEKSSLSDSFINGKNLSFRTYNDHRIAMALAGLKLVFDEISIEGDDAVNKSYPAFWHEVQKRI